MASIIPGYEYDIFISYRQKDNKYDGWVTEFVDNLRKELEATFKEDISVYFDINPHDGLLESHEVTDSLKGKLKCLIFIPIISRTYCDPKSFAWENEFKAFVELASNDQFGLKVKLPGGNVASRVLPVRIYDLNKEDIHLCESVLGGILRGIEFIYKSAGVNRPLRANEDHAQDNLNKIYYRDQINKMSHSIQEIIQGLREGKGIAQVKEAISKHEPTIIPKTETSSPVRQLIHLSWKKIIAGITIVAVLTILILLVKNFKKAEAIRLDSAVILDRAIQVYDPYNYWNNYSGKINLHAVRPDGTKYDEFIEIQTGENYYKSVQVDGRDTTIKGIQDGRYFREIEGNTNPDTVLIKKYGLPNEWIDYMKDFQYCHFGFLMELKRCGMTLHKRVVREKFLGTDCLSLLFTSNDKVANKFLKNLLELTVYIEPNQFTLLGFASPNTPWGDVYVVCSDKVTMNGITFPFCKLYYKKVNNSLLAVDTYLKVE